MKRPSGEFAPQTDNKKKSKKDNFNGPSNDSSKELPKSILKKSKSMKSSEVNIRKKKSNSMKSSEVNIRKKKSKSMKSSEVNIRKKKSNVSNKKPKLKTINTVSSGEPKKSVVKSISSIIENENGMETKVENDCSEVPGGKFFKKKTNNKSNFLIPETNKNKLKKKFDTSNKTQAVDKKELRKKQKELRLKRKEKERSYVLPEKSKKIFEEMRCSKCLNERRKELANELFKVLSGKFVNSARSHELSRMTQWVIKVGSPEIRDRVVEEIIGETVSLSKTKYANHIIKCMLQDCGKKVRKAILNKFLGNVSDLLRNKFGAPLIEEYYSKYAKNFEKTFIRQELYSDLFRGGRNESYTNLSEVLLQNPTLKSAILKSTKTILSKLLDKPFSLSTNLVADVLYDYLQNCEDQDKLEIMEILKTNINALFQTKSGNQVMMLLIWESTPKVKKQMVKELKSHVLTIAKSSGNIFLRSLFDSVDDTVLIRKAILPTILDNAEDLVKDINGKKIILYLVAHRDTSFFHPMELEKLKKADASTFVKKDVSQKEKELLAPCLDILLDKIKANPEFWFSDGKIGLVTQAILSKGSGAKLTETLNAVCRYIVQCVKADNLHPIENPGVHAVLKKILKKVQVEDNFESFPECLVKMCDVEVIKKLFCVNRGCYLLALVIETNLDSVLSCLRGIFKSDRLQKKLEKQESAGAQVLLKQLKEKNIIQC